MSQHEHQSGADGREDMGLHGCRVLDLSDERGLLAGRVLADLGADVVQVEPRDGSPARRMSPRHRDGHGSYYWDAFAANKRGVALDTDHPADQAVIRDLARLADVVIESQGPDVQGPRGLDWPDLHALNPRLVYVSITPFGRTGPKARYRDSDLILWAAGGPLDEHRVGGRPPLRISVPQAYHHGALDAAIGAFVALAARYHTGRGQLVDVSVQAVLGAATLGHVLADAVGDHPRDMTTGNVLVEKRPVDQSGSGTATPPESKKWIGAEGLIEFHIGVGPASGGFTANFLNWMRAEGVELADFDQIDFRTLPARLEDGSFTDDDTRRLRSLIANFLSDKTKAQVLDASMKYKLLCVPIFDLKDVAASQQLAAHDLWRTVGAGDREVLLPGVFAHAREPVAELRGPAPLLGEDSVEVIRTEWAGASQATSWEPQVEALGETGALAGLKVLDLSWVVAGPVVGRTLADFGATVVRVESSRRIETARFMQPFIGGEFGTENSALYSQWNAGKLGLALNLQTEEGRGVARDLADWADVLIESYSPGLMARWGLDYETLRQSNPGLIMLSTSINGQTGPLSGLAGYGNIGAALSGFQSIVGWTDSSPVGPFGPYTDYIGPRFSTLAILAALARREVTGRGTYIDVAQVEAGVFLLSPEIADVHATGRIAERLGNGDRDLAPHGVFPTHDPDRYVAIAVDDDAAWQRLTEIIDRRDLAERPDLATHLGRLAASEELDAALTDWTLRHTPAEVEERLQAGLVPAHRSASSHDFCTDPQLAHRHHLVTLPHERFGEVTVEGPRMLLSDTPGAVRAAAPVIGQHSHQILSDILGYDEARIADLEAKEILA